MWAVYTLPLCGSLGSKTQKLTQGHSNEVCCVVCDVVCGTCACMVWWWCACVYVCVWCVCICMGVCVMWHMCMCGVCAHTVCSVIISQGMEQLDPLEHDLRHQEWQPLYPSFLGQKVSNFCLSLCVYSIFLLLSADYWMPSLLLCGLTVAF